MRTITALIVAVLILATGARYCWLIANGTNSPILATWLLFGVTTSLTFWTYWSSKKHSLLGNINNLVDVITTVGVVLTILVAGKTVRLGFTRFEIGCLITAGIILIFWRQSKQHIISNLLLQTILVIANLPMYKHLWSTEANTESFEVWIVFCLASLTAIVPATINRDKLAIIYATRSATLTFIVILLMVRTELGLTVAVE